MVRSIMDCGILKQSTISLQESSWKKLYVKMPSSKKLCLNIEGIFLLDPWINPTFSLRILLGDVWYEEMRGQGGEDIENSISIVWFDMDMGKGKGTGIVYFLFGQV